MTGAIVPANRKSPAASFDVFALSFAAIGGFVFFATVVIGFAFLLSDYNQSVSACGTDAKISGFGQGPLSPSAMTLRQQILLANWDVTHHAQITPYQASALNQYAANVSKSNLTVNVAPVGINGAAAPVKPGVQGLPGLPVGASTAGSANGYVGVGSGRVINYVPSAVQPLSPCGPPKGIPAAPSLGTNGLSAVPNPGSYVAPLPFQAQISGGLGTSSGLTALLMTGGGGPTLGMYNPTQFASQGVSGAGQGIQAAFSQGGSPVMAAIQVGAATPPYTQSAMEQWQVGGTSIPASTPSALNLAAGNAAQNTNATMNVNYLSSYAAPDSGITYLSQFVTSDSTVNYTEGVAQSTGGSQSFGSGGGGSGQPSNQTTPSQLSNSATASESPSSASGSSASGSSGPSPGSSSSSAGLASGPSSSSPSSSGSGRH